MSNEKQLERWKKMRQKGAAFFIGVYGLLWGLFMMAIICFFQFLVGRFVPGREIDDFFVPLNLGIYLGISLVVGFVWAAVNWFINGRRFAGSNRGDQE